MKSGGFQVKSTQNLINSDVSTRTIQFDECRRGAMTLDFMKSGVIAPSMHPPKLKSFCCNIWIYKVWGGFHLKSTRFHEIRQISCEIERPLARNCNPMFLFCWTKVHFVGSLIAPVLDFVWPSPWVSKQGGSLACTLTCLHAVNLRATSGTTTALSTNRGVHCISVY